MPTTKPTTTPGSSKADQTSPLRLGMVGGGRDAFIGAVHRAAARLDGEIEVVAGALSSSPEKALASGRDLGLADDRNYPDWEAMVAGERERPAGERIDLVSIVTPNDTHFAIARAFADAGFHVVCDKPMVNTPEEAAELVRLVDDRGVVFCVTYNYTGYPMVKEARARVRSGELGRPRKVVVEYAQGWLRTLLEAEGHKQAAWRGDPERAGVSSALGDIGSHAFDLVRYVTGLEVRRLFADLGTVVEGRRMEDDATVLLELEGGVRGLLIASQISTGERNHLRLRVYGSEAGLDWSQESPERLQLLRADGSRTVLYRGAGPLSESAERHSRLPGGHPEGFIEAFANVYRNAADAIRSARGGQGAAHDRGSAAGPPGGVLDFPTVRDGARGVHFIHAAVESHSRGGWVEAAYTPPGGGSEGTVR